MASFPRQGVNISRSVLSLTSFATPGLAFSQSSLTGNQKAIVSGQGSDHSAPLGP